MGAPCGRENCWTCRADKPGRCLKKGIVYKISCQTCQENGKEVQYIGESSRTGFARGGRASGSHCCKEQRLIPHRTQYNLQQELEPAFRMEIKGFYPKPLYRQSREGQLIAGMKEEALMNRRGQWGNNLPPRLELAEERGSQGNSRVPAKQKRSQRVAEEKEDEIERYAKRKRRENSGLSPELPSEMPQELVCRGDRRLSQACQ